MSMISLQKRSIALHSNESGLVAIMVTLIIMSLLTLVTIGFSRLMLREQRQAVDRQLGAQAFYAAESGINDAIRSGAALKNDCATKFNVSGTDIEKELSATDLVSYSCVTVDAGGGDIVYDNISTSESTNFPINNATNVASLTFSWQDSDDVDTFDDGTNFPRFPTLGAWGDATGVLRLTIVPVPETGFNRAVMEANARTYFLYPTTVAGGAVTYRAGGDFGAPGYFDAPNGADSSGQVVSGQCTNGGGAPRACNVTVNGLNVTGATTYYVRLKAVYQPVKVMIRGKDASGTDLALPGAQYIIDATGKANDVLKRIQVRVPLTSSFSWPEYTLDSATSICKQLIVLPGTVDNANCREALPAGMNSDVNGLD